MNAETKGADRPAPPLVYVTIAELGVALGEAPISKFPACWEYQVDTRWRLAFNGHPVAKPCSFSDVPIAPFSCYVTFNGWPAFIIDPNGGFGAAGEGANEDTFLAALRAEIARVDAAKRAPAAGALDPATAWPFRAPS